MIGTIANVIRSRVTASTENLFSHVADPLAHTESHPGDPGLLGPDSVSWPVIGDVAAFIAGIRALLIQTAHPEVVAGVIDHSAFRTDTLGRLSRTSAWITATTFGAATEARAAVDIVNRAHRRVQGHSERGRPYNATDPYLAAWVQNALTDSFLTAYQVYGPRPLADRQADRFVSEQASIGELLGAQPLPETAADLRSWIADHPDIAPTDHQREAIRFLRNPPLPVLVRPVYRLLFWAAAATLPERLQDLLDLSPPGSSISAGRVVARALRWALGDSPSWKRALARVGRSSGRTRRAESTR